MVADLMTRQRRPSASGNIGLAELIKGRADGDHMENYQADIDRAVRRVQGLGRTGLWFLGPAGSNSHIVARDICEGVTGEILSTHPAENMQGVFDALGYISPGRRVGLLPVANTIGGMVKIGSETVLSKILEDQLRLLGFVGLPLEYDAFVREGVDASDIHGWYAHTHPQALAQCDRYIRRNSLVGVGTDSTSGAARALSQGVLGSRAVVIAPPLVGEIYGGIVPVGRQVGDLPPEQNVTLVAVVAGPDVRSGRVRS